MASYDRYVPLVAGVQGLLGGYISSYDKRMALEARKKEMQEQMDFKREQSKLDRDMQKSQYDQNRELQMFQSGTEVGPETTKLTSDPENLTFGTEQVPGKLQLSQQGLLKQDIGMGSAGMKIDPETGRAVQDTESLPWQKMREQAKLNKLLTKMKVGEYNRAGEKHGRMMELPNVSVAQQAMDKEVGKETAKYALGGGYAKTRANLQKLLPSLKELETRDDLTGPYDAKGWDWSRTVLNPDARRIQMDIEFVVQQSLRETLGGQFAKSEGEQLLKRSYSPYMQEKDNARSVRSLMEAILIMGKAKERAGLWLEKHGTMQGYSGFTNFEDNDALRDEILKEAGLDKVQGQGKATKLKASEVNDGETYDWEGKTYKVIKGQWVEQ